MRIATTMLALLLAGCVAPAPEPVPQPGPIETPTPAESAAVAPPVTAPDPCDWQAIALPAHRTMIDITPQALLEAITSADGDVAQLRPLLQHSPQTLGDIAGNWRVRSLQYHRGSVYAYPFFAARIDRNECGHAFAKTTGSQRRTGTLHAIEGEPTRLAFLGASTVNEDPPRNYDPARPTETQRPGEENSAGNLYRIGPDELLMLLDAGDGQRFEVYHLRR